MRDSDVRGAVRKWLRAEYAHEPGTRFVEEMGVWSGSVRIDLAVINGELSGFELKSDRDTLERLPLQADLYSRVFDNLSLVVGCRHATKARTMIPDWWNIIVATEKGGEIALECKRLGTLNPSPEPYLIAQLLWKDEAIKILDVRGEAKGFRAKRVKFVHQHLSRLLSLEELRTEVREALKKRVAWLGQVGTNALDMSIHSNANPVF